jgi:hypothetical protein
VEFGRRIAGGEPGAPSNAEELLFDDADVPLVEDTVEDPLARLGDAQHVAQQLLGVEDLDVSLVCSRPGRCISTLRSVPTSEST